MIRQTKTIKIIDGRRILCRMLNFLVFCFIMYTPFLVFIFIQSLYSFFIPYAINFSDSFLQLTCYVSQFTRHRFVFSLISCELQRAAIHLKPPIGKGQPLWINIHTGVCYHVFVSVTQSLVTPLCLPVSDFYEYG